MALDGGTVHIIQEDGEPYMDVVLKGKTPGVNASCLSWSPAVQSGGGLLLAIGWADGTTMVWSEKDRMQRSDDEQHAGQHAKISRCTSRTVLWLSRSSSSGSIASSRVRIATAHGVSRR